MVTQMEELYHHGILGMHWGVRRFQNEDGTLTKAGAKRMKSVSKDKAAIKRSKATATKSLKKEIKTTDRQIKKASKAVDGDEVVAMLSNKKSRAEQRLSGIKSGTLKAGRDYMSVHTKLYIPIPYVTTRPHIKVGTAFVNDKVVWND